MTPQTFTFASSPFWPVAIGFFGLGTGYFIWGGQALFGYPKAGPEVDRTMGMWGFWMPGFCQFLTGVYLIVGLTWFNVFGNAAPLYMAGVAFTVYGIHWFAMAHRRYLGSSAAPDGWIGDRVFLHFGARNLCVWQGRRYSRHDYLHRSDVDLSRGSSYAAGRVERWLPNRGIAAMLYGNLADVLHLGGHRQSGARLQALDLGRRPRRRTAMPMRGIFHARDRQPYWNLSGCIFKLLYCVPHL